jgi:hypothetical protein
VTAVRKPRSSKRVVVIDPGPAAVASDEGGAQEGSGGCAGDEAGDEEGDGEDGDGGGVDCRKRRRCQREISLCGKLYASDVGGRSSKKFM